MDAVRERIAYLKGLAEGTDLSESGKQGQILMGILNVLQDFSQVIDEQYEDVEDLELYVEEIDEALWDLEGRFEGEYIVVEDDYDVDPDMVEWEMSCPSCGELVYYVDDDDEVVEVLCPVCGEVLWDEEEGFMVADEDYADEEPVLEGEPGGYEYHDGHHHTHEVPTRND